MRDIITIKKVILLAGDAFFLAASLPLSLLLTFGKDFNGEVFSAHLIPFLAIYAFLLTAFYIAGLYDARFFKSATSLAPLIAAAHGAGLLFGVTFFYLTNSWGVTPKTNLAVSLLVSALLVGAWRIIFQRLFARRLRINTALVGLNEHARELAQIMRSRPYMGYNLVATISATDSADKDLVKTLLDLKVDTVITAENLHLNPAVARAFYQCIPHKIQVLDLAQSYELLTGRIPISYISQTWFLENINERQKVLYDRLKRIFDISAALGILIISLPIWPIVAFAIKWESAGPIVYTQERVGLNKKLFRLIKFRSMIQNAERGKPIWAAEKDPRVTTVGAFLRRTHLDELPQMVNILKGDLSLVGPRPERIEFVRQLESQIPHYHIRHIIKPGFTGWAQVNFRYARTPTDTYEKFQYDLYYLKNRSILLDIAVLLKTINLFFKKT